MAVVLTRKKTKPKAFLFHTAEELIDSLGGIPTNRVRINPSPGRATEADVVKFLESADKRRFELVQGTLVEKPMGSREAFISSLLLRKMGEIVDRNQLGVLLGGDGPLRMLSGNVRIPDVSFIPNSSFPSGELPEDVIWDVTPTLIVEVLSESNTRSEITKKLLELFDRGCQLAWIIDRKSQTAEEYTSPTERRVIGSNGWLNGGLVLPGFRIRLGELFLKSLKKKRP